MFTICVYICPRHTFALGLQKQKEEECDECACDRTKQNHTLQKHLMTRYCKCSLMVCVGKVILACFGDQFADIVFKHFWMAKKWNTLMLNSFSKHPFWWTQFPKLKKSRVFGLRRCRNGWRVWSLGKCVVFWKWKFEKACCFFREQMGIRTNGNLEVVFVTLGP